MSKKFVQLQRGYDEEYSFIIPVDSIVCVEVVRGYEGYITVKWKLGDHIEELEINEDTYTHLRKAMGLGETNETE